MRSAIFHAFMLAQEHPRLAAEMYGSSEQMAFSRSGQLACLAEDEKLTGG
jgi:hypothetical protein